MLIYKINKFDYFLDLSTVNHNKNIFDEKAKRSVDKWKNKKDKITKNKKKQDIKEENSVRTPKIPIYLQNDIKFLRILEKSPGKIFFIKSIFSDLYFN